MRLSEKSLIYVMKYLPDKAIWEKILICLTKHTNIDLTCNLVQYLIQYGKNT